MAKGLTIRSAVRAVTDVEPAPRFAVVAALVPSEAWLGPDAVTVPGCETKTLQGPTATVELVVVLQAPAPVPVAGIDIAPGLVPVRKKPFVRVTEDLVRPTHETPARTMTGRPARVPRPRGLAPGVHAVTRPRSGTAKTSAPGAPKAATGDQVATRPVQPPEGGPRIAAGSRVAPRRRAPVPETRKAAGLTAGSGA